MEFQNKTNGKLNTFLRIAITILLGVFIYVQLSFISEVKQDLKEHRQQIEANALAANQQIATNAAANRARLDINNCIVSVPPQTRTQSYVFACYNSVEKDTGVHVKRFGYGLDGYVLPE